MAAIAKVSREGRCQTLTAFESDEAAETLNVRFTTVKRKWGETLRSVKEIEERIKDHERLIEKSKGWKAADDSAILTEAYGIFRAILEAEIGQLKWTIS